MMRLFGVSGTRHTDLSPFTKWTSFFERMSNEFTPQRDKPAVKNWIQFLASIRHNSVSEKITAVNDYMNQIAFLDDKQNYGQSDYWATPMDFLQRGGDCEDYALAKYMSLKALGVSTDHMRLAVVYDDVMSAPHAVLIVYDNGHANVLDNQNPIISDSAMLTRYKPIYSISQNAWWRH